MTYDLFLGLTGFAFAMSITPGPNNLMLMASGANFGLRRTVPHLLGVSVGFGVMATLIGLGLIGLFDAVPGSYLALKVISVVYMLWLAWKIARAAAPEAGAGSGTPLTFLQAAAFQWVNPKAWAMALSAITIYAPHRGVQAIVLVALIFSAVNLPSVSTWALAGQQIRRILTNPGRLRLFNYTMALLLLASLYPVLVALPVTP